MSSFRKKPFPWKCQNCREKAVYEAIVPYETDVEHDGRSHHIQIADLKTPKCQECGFVQLDAEADEAVLREFRKQTRILAPEQIRGYREDLELTQKEFAAALGISEATVSRWENGVQIQQKSLDKLMRLFFGRQDVRQLMIAQRLEELVYSGSATIGRVMPSPIQQVREELVEGEIGSDHPDQTFGSVWSDLEPTIGENAASTKFVSC